jgi:hypothetical protein
VHALRKEDTKSPNRNSSKVFSHTTEFERQPLDNQHISFYFSMVLFKQREMKEKDVIFDISLIVDGSSCYSQISKHDHSRSSPTSRRVKFVLDNDDDGNSGGEGLNIHQLEPLSEEEICSYYMQRQDFTRCDADTKEAILEWAKYQMGHRKECPNTRGLEDLIDQLKHRMMSKKTETSRLVKKSQHVRQVLQEVSRQKSSSSRGRGGVATRLDTEQIRRVSLELSKEARLRAKQVALADAEEAREILLGGDAALKALYLPNGGLVRSSREPFKSVMMANEQ